MSGEELPPGVEPIDELPPGAEPIDAPAQAAVDAHGWPTQPIPVDAPAQDPREQASGEQDAQVAQWFKGSLDQPLEKRAASLKLAKDAGLDPEWVGQNYDAYKLSWDAAQHDPKKWREENPALDRLIRAHPQLGETVVADVPLSMFHRALNKLADAADWLGVSLPGNSGSVIQPGAGQSGEPITTEPAPAQSNDWIRTTPTQAAYRVDQRTKTLDDSGAVTRAARIAFTRFEETRQGVRLSELQHELMRRRAANEAGVTSLGGDTYELEKQILTLKQQATPLLLNEGPWEKLLADVSTATASSIGLLETAGVAGGAAAVVAGGVTYAATKSPAAAENAALRVGSFVGNVSMALGTYRLEAGDQYGQLLEAKTDDGRPLTNLEATGGAVLTGIFNAAIEMGELNLWAKAAGPAGLVLKKGEVSAGVKALLEKDVPFRAMVAKAAKAWAIASAGEGGEEVAQYNFGEAMQYFFSSLSQRKWQKGFTGTLEESAKRFEAGAIGAGLGQGLLAPAVNISTQVALRGSELQAGHQAATIAGLESPTAKAAPVEVAQSIADATAATGKPVTSLFVDADQFMRFFQEKGEDPAAALGELSGKDGVFALQEAITSGGNIEVPVARYLEKWGGTEVARALVEDTTTQPEFRTTRQMRAEAADVQGQAEKLAALYDSENPQPKTADEKQFVSQVEELILAAPHLYDDKQGQKAKQALALRWAFERSMGEMFGMDPGELFAVVKQSVAYGETAPGGAMMQEVDSSKMAQMQASFEALPPAEQAQRRFRDANTGLFNARGFSLLPMDPARPLVVTYDLEGNKFLNDEHGHASVDGALRVMADALRAEGVKDGAKIGGSIRALVADQAQAERVREALAKAVGGGLSVVMGTAERTANLDESMAAADQSGRRSQDAAVAAGTHGHRLGVPAAFNPGRVALVGEDGKALSTPEASAVRAQAKASSLGLAQSLAAHPASNVPLEIGAEHQANFEANRATTFRDVHLTKEGLWTEEGFRLAAELEHPSHYVSADVRGLAGMNSVFSKQGADIVLATFARLLASQGGGEFNVSHPHGDEFQAFGNDPARLKQFFVDLEEEAKKQVFYKYLPHDRVAIQVGVQFAHGLRETLDAADRIALPEAKRLQGDVVGPREISVASFESEIKELGLQGSYELVDVGSSAESGLRGAASQVEQQGPVEAVAQQTERLLQSQSSRTIQGWTESRRQDLTRVLDMALTKHADLSTYLHESGHVFLELMGDFSERPDAPERLKNDFAAALKWLGVENRSELQREHHEKWARSFELYLMEGKAPSAALEGAFASFKLWLLGIYQIAKNLLGRGAVELNPEIRGVFDRLLATDEEIARAQKGAGLTNPVFAKFEDSGMTPEEWQTYLAEREQSVAHVRRQAELTAMKDRLRAQERWWKEATAVEKAQAEADYEAQPGRIAQLLLSGKPAGEWLGMSEPLERKAVEEVVGKEAGKKFRVAKEGLSPDEVLEAMGVQFELWFRTGAGMLQAVAALEDKSSWVDRTVAERLTAKYPTVLDDRTELRAVIAKGINGEQTAAWLTREWAALRKKAGIGAPAPVDAVKQAARQIVGRRTVAKLDAGTALRQERSAAEKAAKAVLKGDFAQAAVLKQQQLLNSFLHGALLEAREERAAFEALVGKLSTDKSRARLGLARAVYRDGVDLVLETLGLKEADPNREAPLPSIGEVVTALADDGATVAFDEQALGKLLAQPKPWKELTVAELRTVDSALRNIRTAARGVATAIVDGKRAAKADVVAELIREAQANLPSLGQLRSSESARTTWQKTTDLWTAFDGALLKPETMIRGFLGKGELGSWWFRAVLKPLQDAKAREVDLLEHAIAPILKTFEALPAKLRARMMERVDGAALFPEHKVGEGVNLSPPTRRFELLMMALNAGNESNLSRLLEGRNITLGQLGAALDLLTKEELDWVQSVWDASEGLWPEARALEERDSGVAPEKIPPRPLTTKAGTWRGGYFPALYDSLVEVVGAKTEARAVADLMDPSYVRPGTARSHLRARSEGFTGAISLEPAAIGRHLSQVAHDIAFREALKSVGGLVLNVDVRNVLVDRLGEGRARQFLQWLKDIGQMRGAEGMTHGGPLLKAARLVRANTVIAALGYALPNAIEDLSNLVAALPRTELRARHLAAGLAQFAASPLQSLHEAMAKSGELRSRHSELQRELAQQTKSLVNTGWGHRLLEPIRKHAFVFMEFSDKATSTPIWLGSYRQALAAGEDEAAAVTFADSVVRQVFPSHSAVDAAAILRDKGYLGTALTFYGFLSTYYNGLRELLHPLHTEEEWAGKAKALPAVAGRLLGYSLAVTVLSEFLRGRGPEGDDGEDDAERWTNWFLRKELLGSLAAVPFGGDLDNAIQGWLMNKRSNPRNSSLAGTGAELLKAILQLGSEKVDDGKKAADLARALGPAAGIPVVQPARTLRYLSDVAGGDREVNGPLQAISGAIYGERDNQPLNPLTAVDQLANPTSR